MLKVRKLFVIKRLIEIFLGFEYELRSNVLEVATASA